MSRTDHIVNYYQCPICRAGRKDYGVDPKVELPDGWELYRSTYDCGTELTAHKKKANYKAVKWDWCTSQKARYK